MMATDFGRDTSCLDSLRTGRLVSGARLVGEAAYRRLTTPTGTLRGGDEENNYGLDLSAMVGAQSPATVAAALPGRIRTELLKDERINDVTAIVTVVTDGPSTSFDIAITGKTDVGPFDLRLSVDQVSASLVGLSTEDDS